MPRCNLSYAKLSKLIGIAQLSQHFVADIDGWGGKDDACRLRSAVEDELESLALCDALDGIIDFVLDGFHECHTLLIEFALRSEIFLLQFRGFLFLIDDGLLAFLFWASLRNITSF